MSDITTRTVDLGGGPELTVVPSDLEDMTIEEAEAAGLINYETPEEAASIEAEESPAIQAEFFRSQPYIAFVLPTELGPAQHVLTLEDAMTLRGVLGDEIEKALADGS